MQPIEMPHDLQVGRGYRPRQVVHAATADAQGHRLLADRKIVLAHDHRLALSKPALPSATSKKSFSSVSSPILAWSDFTSIGGGLAPVPAADPNTPAAPSWSCVFHCVIWLGCTSKCCASSATVFWPLIAANATFALNAGVWFRRARLLIVSPDSSGTACPLSGRNSTYPPVQISGASSDFLCFNLSLISSRSLRIGCSSSSKVLKPELKEKFVNDRKPQNRISIQIAETNDRKSPKPRGALSRLPT